MSSQIFYSIHFVTVLISAAGTGQAGRDGMHLQRYSILSIAASALPPARDIQIWMSGQTANGKKSRHAASGIS